MTRASADNEEVLVLLAGLGELHRLSLLTEVMHELIAQGVPSHEVYCAIAEICRNLPPSIPQRQRIFH